MTDFIESHFIKFIKRLKYVDLIEWIPVFMLVPLD